jgi:hypothetical protein
MAQNIWGDAFNNSLRKPGSLEPYVKDDPGYVNKPGGEKSVTPLAYTCFRDHLEVVTLLLKHGARPNVICPYCRTGPFSTLTQASPNRLLIIKALPATSDGTADPNEVYPGVNALTLAIEELRDNHIVESLIPFNTPLSDFS